MLPPPYSAGLQRLAVGRGQSQSEAIRCGQTQPNADSRKMSDSVRRGRLQALADELCNRKHGHGSAPLAPATTTSSRRSIRGCGTPRWRSCSRPSQGRPPPFPPTAKVVRACHLWIHTYLVHDPLSAVVCGSIQEVVCLESWHSNGTLVVHLTSIIIWEGGDLARGTNSCLRQGPIHSTLPCGS